MDFFSIARQGNIGILTMNRPPMNNFNLQMYRELQESIAAINADDDIWAAIFRAEGKNFCTGNDVKEFINLTDQKSAAAYADKVSIAVGSVGACRVPLVGAINGMALGTGLGLASLCDVLVADDKAKFGIPEARVGSPPRPPARPAGASRREGGHGLRTRPRGTPRRAPRGRSGV